MSHISYIPGKCPRCDMPTLHIRVLLRAKLNDDGSYLAYPDPGHGPRLECGNCILGILGEWDGWTARFPPWTPPPKESTP